MDEIKPEEIFYYEDTTTFQGTNSGSLNYTFNLQPRTNIMPVIERINQIIDHLNKKSLKRSKSK